MVFEKLKRLIMRKKGKRRLRYRPKLEKRTAAPARKKVEEEVYKFPEIPKKEPSLSREKASRIEREEKISKPRKALRPEERLEKPSEKLEEIYRRVQVIEDRLRLIEYELRKQRK